VRTVTWFGSSARFDLPAELRPSFGHPDRPGIEIAPDHSDVDLEYQFTPVDDRWVVVVAGVGISAPSSPGAAIERAWRHLELHVAAHAVNPVFLHAGAVAFGPAGFVFPGSSGTGKTTLVLDLVRAGATYYSDEYALIDAQGLLHPYPRPPHLRANPHERGRPVPVAQLGGPTGELPVAVDRVVFSTFAPGARWSPARCPQGTTVLKMMEHAVAARTRTAAVMDALAALAQGATAYEGQRGTTGEVLDWFTREGSLR